MLNVFRYILLLVMFFFKLKDSSFLYFLTLIREAFFSPLHQPLALQSKYLKMEHGQNNGVFIKSNARDHWTASSNNHRGCWKFWVSGNFKEDFNSREFYLTTFCNVDEDLIISPFMKFPAFLWQISKWAVVMQGHLSFYHSYNAE